VPTGDTDRRTPPAAPHACPAISVRAPELSDPHMLILGRIAHHAPGDAQDIADWLGVPVEVALALCADLETAGLLTTARDN
jgi:hypothetical protein